MTINRSLLAQAFPNNPRLRAEVEALADNLDAAQTQLDTLLQSASDATARLASLENTSSQPHSAMLDAISEVSDADLGVFEKVGQDQVILHQVDSGDDACLVPRYKLISYVGTGATANRPALSAQMRAIFFDTTLAVAGKPIFWTGENWVDATGVIA